MKILERYVARIIGLYFVLAWVLLTVVLFVQQGNRFTEVLLGVVLPFHLLLVLGGSLIVTVLAFTAPMAILAGIVIGLGQLRGDSEITAMFAAGAGRRVILRPALLGGFLISIVSLGINLWGVPFASRAIRNVTREAALIKLDSPLEPKVFSTEFGNNVIYVRDADEQKGLWQQIFIFAPENNGQRRLITARDGRIDASSDKSELVLFEAVMTTLPANATATENKQITIENLSSLRLSLGETRQKVLSQLQKIEKLPDEMGLGELADFANKKNGRARLEALVLWHRRLALALAPIVLAFLGVALSLKFGKSGRGSSALLALIAIVAYYLLTLLGEQTVRTEILPPAIGGWLATMIAVTTSLWWFWRWPVQSSNRKLNLTWLGRRFRQKTFLKNFARVFSRSIQGTNRILGLLEREILSNLLKNFLLISAALWILFLVFTVFELFRSLVSDSNSLILLIKYLIFLSPMVFLQIAPSALMLSVLITYALKVRNNEVVVWGAAGQSVYVLLIPCFMLALALTLVGWEWQEYVLPRANQKQDALRAQLKGEGSAGKNQFGQNQERFWVAASNGIYSFVTRKQLQNQFVRDVYFFEFTSDKTHLQKVYQAANGIWQNEQIALSDDVKEIIWKNSLIETNQLEQAVILSENKENPFDLIAIKPSHLNTFELEKLVQNTESPVEKRRLELALQKKYANTFLFFVTVFFSAPLALSLRSRKAISFAIGNSIAIWLFLMVTIAFFDKLGSEAILPAAVAVWSPLIIFSSLGWYLLARLRH